MIVELSDCPHLLETASQYFWKTWGSDTNYPFYKDCIEHSVGDACSLPKFYLLLDAEEQIVGTYALLVNDLVSRQDLVPWLACLYVEEANRNQGHAARLLAHALEQAKAKGFEYLHLSTDLDGFYEKKGWTHFSTAYGVTGAAFKVYRKSTK